MPTDLFTLLSPKNIILFVVLFTRLSGMMASAPLVSTYPVPIHIKAWFMAIIAFVMFPVVMAHINFVVPTTLPGLIIIVVREFFIGYIVGFVANIVFYSVEIAAELISMQMGLTAAQAMNPTTGDSSSIMTQAYTLLVSMIFIGINGLGWIISSVFKTYQLIPPGYGFIFSGQLAHNFIYITSQIFVIGLGIAMPIFAVLIITDILLGFVAKMMPKMNIFMVAMPVKIYLGLILLVMLISPMYTQLQVALGKYLASTVAVFGLGGG